MASKILIALGIVVIVVLGLVIMQPDEYTVARSIEISAPSELIFPMVNDLKQFNEWNPWAKLDADSKIIYAGASEGVGAIYTWDGNSQVGEGKMTITESRQNESVGVEVEFIKPFTSTAKTLFTLQPQGELTHVTWTMSGKNNFMGKFMGLVVSMDKMIGNEFEKGLANLKVLSEKR